MKQIFALIAVFVFVGSTASLASAQTAGFGTTSPFHNLNGGQVPPAAAAATAPAGAAGPGSISIPPIMPVKRPLPRKPVQPVFIMKGIDLGADAKIQSIDKMMRGFSGKLIEARKNRNNRLAMQYVRKMEQARQKLLRHLRELAPVEKSFAPVPTPKNLPKLPTVDSTVEELPILPMPKMPSSDKRK